jgi:hypothetical protein
VLLAIILLPLIALSATRAPLPAVPPVAPYYGSSIVPARDGSDEDSVYYEYGFEDNWAEWSTVDLTDPGLTWHSTETNAMPNNGRSFWSGKEELGGYDNHWLQYINTPALNLAGRQNLTLRFNVTWAVESAENPPDTAEFPGYDSWDGCNVWASIDGGQNWQVIRPAQPAYSHQSLFSFGYEWGMGRNIPGWTGTSNGWVAATFNIQNFARNNVMFRWAFCSDPGICTIDDESLIGMAIDNLQVMAGNDVVWSNNGDALNDMSRAQGPVSGDHWEITTDDANSGENSARCPILGDLSNALVTPEIEVPEVGWYTYFDFWVRADTRRSDSNGDNNLDDFFEVQVSSDQVSWERIIYDYGRDEEWMNNFHYYGPDTTFRTDYPEWKRKLNLTQFAGQSIWLRWVVNTDSDVDGEQGDGIFIDDFRILITQRRQDDVGVEWAWVKYPTAMGFSTPGRVLVRNFGLGDQQRVTKYYRVADSPDFAIIPWGGLPADSTEELPFTVDQRRLTFADSLTIRVHAHAAADSSHENDTAFVDNVVVYPADIFLLGYDNRAYSLRYNFDPGAGPAIRFTPTDDNVRIAFDLKALRVRWNGEQENQAVDTRLHIYRDNAGEIGQEIHTQVVSVDGEDILPNVGVIDLSGVEALRGMRNSFWVWFEILRADHFPQIVGAEQKFGAGHYYSYNGNRLTEMQADWMCHAVIMPAGANAQNELKAGRSTLDFGAVEAGRSNRLGLALFNGGVNEVTIEEATCASEDIAIEFDGPVTLRIGDIARVYVTYSAANSDAFSAALRFRSTDNTPPVVWLLANGGVSVPTDPVNPTEFTLGEAYPNPFNSRTLIPFSIASQTHVRLAIYDLAGRVVSTLVDEVVEAGSYRATLDASQLSTGVYLYRLDAQGFSSIRKVVVVK